MTTTTAMVKTGEQSVALQGRVMRPIAQPQELVAAHKEAVDLVMEVLEEGIDFGQVPGTEGKTLLKPGAERLAVAYGCRPEYTIIEHEVEHDREVEWASVRWVTRSPEPGREEKERKLAENTARVFRDRKDRDKWIYQEKREERGVSLGLYRYVVRCDLIRFDGAIVGSCVGACSTMETKYVRAPRDAENTVLKMAQKRAVVGAVLGAFGLSGRFDQDADDDNDHAQDAPPAEMTTEELGHMFREAVRFKAREIGARFTKLEAKNALTDDQCAMARAVRHALTKALVDHVAPMTSMTDGMKESWVKACTLAPELRDLRVVA